MSELESLRREVRLLKLEKMARSENNDCGFREFLTSSDVPRSAIESWVNGADNWEELVYDLGMQLDEKEGGEA